MTCLEAQSNIMAFIDKKLPEDKITDFTRHMKYCPNCAEELEIYYTLIVGMRQLDNNEEMSQDFKKDMFAELEKLSNKVRNAKRFKLSTFGIVAVAAVVMFVFTYMTCLTKVYNIEQRVIKERQTIEMYYEAFVPYMSICEEDIIEVATNNYLELQDDNKTYKLIHEYNLAQEKSQTEEDIDE